MSILKKNGTLFTYDEKIAYFSKQIKPMIKFPPYAVPCEGELHLRVLPEEGNTSSVVFSTEYAGAKDSFIGSDLCGDKQISVDIDNVVSIVDLLMEK